MSAHPVQQTAKRKARSGDDADVDTFLELRFWRLERCRSLCRSLQTHKPRPTVFCAAAGDDELVRYIEVEMHSVAVFRVNME